MTQISSAGRFHSHKASSKGSSAVGSSAHCRGREQSGTWLLGCVTVLSSISSTGSKGQRLLNPKQGEQCENKCSLKRTKSLGALLPCIIIYAGITYDSKGSVLVEVVWGCRALIKAGLTAGTWSPLKPQVLFMPWLPHPCEGGLVLLTEQVSATWRKEFLLLW